MTTYVPTPPATDHATLLKEERVRTRHLRRLLADADAEIAARERTIQELYLERE